MNNSFAYTKIDIIIRKRNKVRRIICVGFFRVRFNRVLFPPIDSKWTQNAMQLWLAIRGIWLSIRQAKTSNQMESEIKKN